MPSREVKVAIIGDARGFSQAVNEANGSLGRLGGSFTKFAKIAAAGAAAGIAGAAVIGKGLYDAAIESQKVTKQTEAVIASMGNASKISAKQVADLSTQLSMKSGIDDELIQSGENLLLTFGNVRNEVGKGNDIFTRATKTAVDMSVALGQDLKSSNIQLGKALNDPIKGISALSRVGVSFTQQQKDQVEALVKSGKTLEAQKLILGEVEKQFKGSAAAQATAGAKLKVVWGNLQETLGAKLVPIVEKAASFLADKLPGAMDALGRAAGPIFKKLSVGWDAFLGGFENPDAINHVQGFAGAMIDFGAKVAKVIAWIQANWPKIQQVIGSVMETVGSIVSGVLTVVRVAWENFGNNILELVQRIWPRVQQVIEGALAIIRSVVQVITSLIQGDWSGVWEGIKGIVSGAWTAIQGIVGGALEILRSAIGIAMEVVGSVIKGAWNGILGFFQGIPGKIGGFFKGLAEILIAPYRAAFNSIAKLWNSTIGKLSFKIPSWVPGLGGKGFDVPDIPTFHTGGVYKAPNGQAEGLALLRNNEVVLTPGQAAAGGRPMVVQLVMDQQVIAEKVIDYGRLRDSRNGFAA